MASASFEAESWRIKCWIDAYLYGFSVELARQEAAGEDHDHDKAVRAEAGDQLWVKESFAIVPATAYRNSDGVAQTVDPNDLDNAAIYRAGFDRSGRPRWKPSIHLPRWASRITLKVTGVKIERLQDISEEDAISEGVPRDFLEHVHGPAGFRDIWESIHGPGSWEANPWVVAVSFSTIMSNVDAAIQAERG